MKLYVTNLSFEVTEALLIDWFRRGKVDVTHCHIPRDVEGHSRRYGFITVTDVDAPGALKLGGKYMLGQPMRIKKASQNKSANTRKVGRG